MSRLPAHSKNGFTVIELLAVITIILVLSALLVGVTVDIQKKAAATKCSSNLRTVAAAFAAFAADNNGDIFLSVEKQGTGGSVQWLRYLIGMTDGAHNRGTGGPVYLESKDVAVCPSTLPFSYSGKTSDYMGYTYGTVYRNANDPFSKVPSQTKSGSRAIRLSTLPTPASYWLLTDSFHPGLNKQIFYVRVAPSSTTPGVHFRHAKLANALFADGHVAGLDPEAFSKLPYNPLDTGFDEEKNIIHAP